jgi:methionyl-tRNA synthetase
VSHNEPADEIPVLYETEFTVFDADENPDFFFYVSHAICPYCGEETDATGDTCKECGRKVDL